MPPPQQTQTMAGQAPPPAMRPGGIPQQIGGAMGQLERDEAAASLQHLAAIAMQSQQM